MGFWAKNANLAPPHVRIYALTHVPITSDALEFTPSMNSGHALSEADTSHLGVLVVRFYHTIEITSFRGCGH